MVHCLLIITYMCDIEVIFQAATSSELPYPAKWNDFIQRLLPIFNLNVISIGDGTCFAKNISTVEGIVLKQLAVFMTIFW